MRLKVADVAESSTTHLANEGPLAGVRALMLDETAFGLKQFQADFTLVSLLDNDFVSARLNRVFFAEIRSPANVWTDDVSVYVSSLDLWVVM